MSENNRLINFMIDKDLLNEFRDLAKSRYTTATMLIRQYIIREITKHKKTKQEKESGEDK